MQSLRDFGFVGPRFDNYIIHNQTLREVWIEANISNGIETQRIQITGYNLHWVEKGPQWWEPVFTSPELAALFEPEIVALKVLQTTVNQMPFSGWGALNGSAKVEPGPRPRPGEGKITLS